MDLNRLNNYDKDHCWQYEMRLNNREEDLAKEGLTEEYVKSIIIPEEV